MLKERLAPVLERVKPLREKLGKIPKKVFIIAAVAVAIVIAIVIAMSLNRPYEVLFTEMNSDEATAVMAMLDDYGVRDYRLVNGDTILVPKSQESTLKAKLVMAGYPKSGYAYSTYFDNVSALSTESERNRAFLLSVQDRLGAVVREFDGVRDAVVTITQGEDRRYVLDSSNVVGATASVAVTMQDGQTLTKAQVEGIKALVSHSVQGLEISSVTVIDTKTGNTYSGTANETADSEASALKLRLEEEQENKVRTEILNVLVPIFGEGNVRVGVNCVVELSNSVVDDVEYHLPDWADEGQTNGAGIIGSRVYEYYVGTDDETLPGGTVGTTTNADLPTVVEREPDPEDVENRISGGGQLDYKHSTTTTHTIRTAGYVTDCTVAITINSAAVSGPLDTASIRNHAAAASGIVATEENRGDMTADQFLDSKINILAMDFYAIDDGSGNGNGALNVPYWALYAAIAGIVLFLILLILLLLIRRKKRAKQKAQEEEQNEVAELLAYAGMPSAETPSADVMSLQTEKSMELRQNIRKFAEDNPELAAQLVRNWLRGDEEDG